MEDEITGYFDPAGYYIDYGFPIYKEKASNCAKPEKEVEDE